MTVSSQIRVGSTFTLYLPKENDRAETTTDTSNPIPEGTERILITDDERAVRDVTSRMLAGLGYETWQVANGQEALERIKKDENDFDLVLLDVVMPGPACKEVLEKIKELSPSCAVIIMTGHDFGTSRAELVQAGATCFLRKPFERQELAKTVREVLDNPSD